MDIVIGSDHAGFDLKEECKAYLERRGDMTISDVGVFAKTSSDYPLVAHEVARAVSEGNSRRGILICGTGLGMSIVANRYRGIRAALCGDLYTAKMGRLHNDANILVMGARVIGTGVALVVIDVFLDTPFEGGRHQVRLEQIDP